MKLLFLVGPTASGKSELALELASKLGFEIISADSMQVYRGMNIGTAKPTDKIQKQIKHHMLDLRDVNQEYSAFEYYEDVLKLIEKSGERKNGFLVVGGSGLYVSALLHGISKKPGADIDFRKKMKNLIAEKGLDFLKSKLKKIDPEYALIAKDERRIIRALEVTQLSGKTVSEWNKENKGLLDGDMKIKVYGIMWPRETLKKRIAARTGEMLYGGWIDETKLLKDKEWSKTASQAIGYREILKYLSGEISKEELVSQITHNTARFAKRQMTWFRKEPEVYWIALEDSLDKVCQMILKDWEA